MDSGRSYASEKPPLTHPFKLIGLAILCVRSGEFMVFPVTGHKDSPFRDAKIRQKTHSLAVFAGEITAQAGGSAS
jgi:hypothetical protein